MNTIEPNQPKPKIYAFCNGGREGWYHMDALSEDGVFLAGHICSHPAYGPHDMGVTSDWKHETYRKYYPDGYEVVWVDDARTDPRLQEAHAKHLAMGEDEMKQRMARIGEPETPKIVLEVTDDAGAAHTITREF